MRDETYSQCDFPDEKRMMVYSLLHGAKDVSEKSVKEFLDGSELKYLNKMVENKEVEYSAEKGVYNLSVLGTKIARIRHTIDKRKKQGS